MQQKLERIEYLVEFLNKLSLEINGGPLNVLDVISNIENTLKLIDKIEDLDLGSQTVAELYASQNFFIISDSNISFISVESSSKTLFANI